MGADERAARSGTRSRAAHLPAYTTERLSADAERVEWIKANAPDVLLVIDFGHIIKEPVLTAAKYGCLNIHPSKLPEYRGSAPLQRVLMDGRASTAVSIFRLDSGMDSGPILAQPELAIAPEDDFASLAEKAAKLGAETLLHYLCDVPPDEWRFTAQSEDGATYAPKIDKAEGKIDWTRPAAEIADKIRGIGAAPGVFCTVRTGPKPSQAPARPGRTRCAAAFRASHAAKGFCASSRCSPRARSSSTRRTGRAACA